MSTAYASDGDNLSPGFNVSVFQDLIDPRTSEAPFTSNSSQPAFEISNNNVKVGNDSGLVYSVPKNTTLLRVFGSTSDNSCYAVLQPPPSWWDKTQPPTSMWGRSRDPSDHQDLFWLPVDPEIEYELILGSWHREALCWVGGVSSFSFF